MKGEIRRILAEKKDCRLSGKVVIIGQFDVTAQMPVFISHLMRGFAGMTPALNKYNSTLLNLKISICNA
jgi:hypothetical protein